MDKHKNTEAKGGLTNGKSHEEGGIEMIVKSTGQKVELEGGEGVVNKYNMSSEEKRDFNGSQKTNCEIISEINEENGNGVKFNCKDIQGQFKGQSNINRILATGGVLDNGFELEIDDYQLYKINALKEKMLEGGVVDIDELIQLENSLGYNREQLPQLRSHYKDEFIEELKKDNVNVNYTYLNPNILKPSQKEVNYKKIKKLNEKIVFENNILISNDNYVIDGHHRWFYFKNLKKDIPCILVDLTFSELIKRLKNFGKTEFSDIDSPISLYNVNYDISFEDGGLILNSEDEINFNEWIKDNVIEVSDGIYLEQTTGYKKKFTKNELEKFFKREYSEENYNSDNEFANGGTVTKKNTIKILPFVQKKIINSLPPSVQNEMLENVKEALYDIPKLYEQDGKGLNAIVYLHYFVGGTDWYVTEYSKDDNTFFGYVILNSDTQSSSLGYIDISYITDNDYGLNSPELDLYWSYKTLNEIFEEKYPDLVKKPILRYSAAKKEIIETKEDFRTKKFKNRFEKNIFIQLLIDKKGNDPEKYSIYEKEFISQYSGMGGLEKQGATAEEDGKGLLYEYYTPTDIAEFMWGLAYKYQTRGILNVLEPSVGVGVYCQTAPSNVIIEGFDVSKYAIAISQILYPQHFFNLKSFEELFIRKNKSVKSKVIPTFDLVIGNPPYGSFTSKYSSKGEKQYTKATNFVEYFISRGLDLLKKDGLLIYVIGSVPSLGGTPFLDDKKRSKVFQEIIKKADLVDAYRLGSNMFTSTDVDSDVIVLRKK